MTEIPATFGRTQALAWLALLICVGGLLFPLGFLALRIRFTGGGGMVGPSSRDIFGAAGCGVLAELLASILGSCCWRHSPAKVAAIGGSMLALLGMLVAFSHAGSGGPEPPPVQQPLEKKDFTP